MINKDAIKLITVFFATVAFFTLGVNRVNAQSLTNTSDFTFTPSGAGEVLINDISTSDTGEIVILFNYNSDGITSTVDLDPTAGVDTVSLPESTGNGQKGMGITYIKADGSYGESVIWKEDDVTFYPVGVDINNNEINIVGYTRLNAEPQNYDLNPFAGTDIVTNAAAGNATGIIISLDIVSGSIEYDWGEVILRGSGGGDVFFHDVVSVYNSVSMDYDVYLSGTVSGKFYLDMGINTELIDTGATYGGENIIVKFDSNGDYQFGNFYDTNRGTYGASDRIELETDPTNQKVYTFFSLTGNNIDLDGTAGTDLYSTTGRMFAIQNIDTSTGGPIWTKTWEGDIAAPGYIFDLKIDESGNIYTLFRYAATVDVSLDPDDLRTITAYDPNNPMILNKLDSSGSTLWVRTLPASTSDSVENSNPQLTILGRDILVTGVTEDTASLDFDEGTGTDLHTGITDEGTAYITRLDIDNHYFSTNLLGSLDSADNTQIGMKPFKSTTSNSIYLGANFKTDSFDKDFGAGTSTVTPTVGAPHFIEYQVNRKQIDLPGSNGATVSEAYNNNLVTVGFYGDQVPVVLTDSDGQALARIDTDLTTDRDWTGLTLDSNGTSSLVVDLVSLPGTASTYDLLIRRSAVDKQVLICPGVTAINQIVSGCTDGALFTDGQTETLGADTVTVSIETINGVSYWVASGVSGTGGSSISGSLQITSPIDGEIDSTSATEVTIEYAPGVDFVSGDTITLEIDPALNAALSDCGTPTDDVDGDTTTDGGFGSFTNSNATYTFTADTTDVVASGVTLCITFPAGIPQGSYGVYITDTNGNFGGVLAYVNDDNDVFISAEVALTLSFNIRTSDDTADINSCAIGVVTTGATAASGGSKGTPASTHECSYGLAIGTNATNGFSATIEADTDPTNGTESIADITDGTNFVAGTEGYGIVEVFVSETGGDGAGTFDQDISLVDTVGSAFASNNLSADATPIPTTSTSFLTHNDAINYVAGTDNSDLSIVVHGMNVSAATPAGVFGQTVSYQVTPSF